MSIEEIITELQAWLEAHPDAESIDEARVRRCIRILQGIDA